MPRYRITVFGNPREGAPWRDTRADALRDAVRLKLASWDESRQEHFLAVPVDMAIDWQNPREPHPWADDL